MVLKCVEFRTIPSLRACEEIGGSPTRSSPRKRRASGDPGGPTRLEAGLDSRVRERVRGNERSESRRDFFTSSIAGRPFPVVIVGPCGTAWADRRRLRGVAGSRTHSVARSTRRSLFPSGRRAIIREAGSGEIGARIFTSPRKRQGNRRCVSSIRSSPRKRGSSCTALPRERSGFPLSRRFRGNELG
jgi:hypothetical protein